MVDPDSAHRTLIERLGRLGRQPVPPDVASAHLVTLGATAPGGRSWGRFALVAAVAAAVAGGGLVAVAATGYHRSDGSLASDQPAQVEPAQQDQPDDDPCHGPPPFAGTAKVGDTKAEQRANHRAAVQEHVATRRACGDDTGDSGEDDPAADPAAPDDPCTGPPPWAGPNAREARPDDREAAKATKAAERAEWAASRAGCPDDADPDTETDAGD
jgi:hypothetical protein